ncbi:MAG: HAD-IA family hydrolase [Betaproteobacteria bacterium]|nr:HAD-IA family hydrolase [Betaproteobacteria bacterium]
MPKQFELLVFDWDGTLMDSAAVIVESIQAASGDLGLPVPSDEAARHIIGLGLTDALGYLFPQLPQERYGDLVERYRFHFLARDSEIPLFGGAQEAIRELHQAGFLLAVATGKSRVGLDRALGNTGLRAYFHASRCADEGFSKPHPGMLLALMEELGMAADRTLMIGDTTHDLQMAANAGVAAVGAAYGAHPRDNLLALSPLACLESFAELHRWLMSNA